MTAVDLPLAPPRPRRERLLQRIAGYSMSRGVTEGLLGVRGVLLATTLGPTAFGVWAVLRLSMRYAAFSGLGIFRGLELELLSARERGGEEGVRETARAALGFILAVSGSLAVTALGASFVLRDPSLVILLRGFAAAVVLEQVYGYALIWTRVRTTLRRYASLEMANAALQTVSAVALARIWGLGGAFAGVAVASALALVIASRWVGFRPALRLEPLRRLLGIGVPLFLSMMLATALGTADRWAVAAMGGATMLGYYAFAASVAGLAASFAWVIRTVVFPDVYGDAQSAGAAIALRRHLDRAVRPFAMLYPPLLGALACLLAPAVALVTPEFLPATAPARVFLLSGVPAGLVSLAAVGAVAAGRQRMLPALSGTALVVSLGLAILAIRVGTGLEAVAVASFAGQTIYASGVVWLTLRESRMDRPRGFLLRTLLPLAWCTAAAVVAGRLVPGTDPVSGLRALLAYLVLITPLVPSMRREWQKVRG